METELIDGLLGGSSRAWEVLIDRYGGLVRSRVIDVACLFGRKGDWSTIDDVTAEVFASLLARDAAALRCFRGQSSLATYLAVIATRVARRMVAKIVRETLVQPESLDDLDARTHQTGPESMLIGREERERLLVMVDRLPKRQRELVVAFYREEQTYAEISHRFDIPIGSIGTTLRRAEERLRQWIDDETQ
ncbi:MAG: sigma-70 family RNA polymerase sigma factor [Planctomycetales bacterium]|nr:sigma-70 family RNA polymerase sigma factor [Planctomycetales bacterium]